MEVYEAKFISYSVGDFIFHIFEDNRASPHQFGSSWREWEASSRSTTSTRSLGRPEHYRPDHGARGKWARGLKTNGGIR